MRILITGFEPFGGQTINPSAEVVRALTGSSVAGEPLRTAILPVADPDGPARLMTAVREHQPQAVILLGQAARRAAVSIERLAINLKSCPGKPRDCGGHDRARESTGLDGLDGSRAVDGQADGLTLTETPSPGSIASSTPLPAEGPIVPGAPAAYFATLPVHEMYAALRAAGIPAELSRDAGVYLCNQVSYVLLHAAATDPLNCRAGFVHLPLLPEQAAAMRPPAPSMSLETMCRAVRIAIETVVGQAGRLAGFTPRGAGASSA